MQESRSLVVISPKSLIPFKQNNQWLKSKKFLFVLGLLCTLVLTSTVGLFLASVETTVAKTDPAITAYELPTVSPQRLITVTPQLPTSTPTPITIPDIKQVVIPGTDLSLSYPIKNWRVKTPNPLTLICEPCDNDTVTEVRVSLIPVTSTDQYLMTYIIDPSVKDYKKTTFRGTDAIQSLVLDPKFGVRVNMFFIEKNQSIEISYLYPGSTEDRLDGLAKPKPDFLKLITKTASVSATPFPKPTVKR